MKRKSVFVISEIPWNFLRQRHHEVALFFSKKGFRVIFVGPVYSRIPPFKNILKKISRKLINLFFKSKSDSEVAQHINKKNIIFKSSLLIPSNLFKSWNNFYLLFILKIKKDDIIYSFSPTINFCSNNKFNFIIFDVIHNWWGFKNFSPSFYKNLDDISTNAELIITDSGDVSDLIKKNYNRDVHLMLPALNIPNGVNITKPPMMNTDIKLIFFGNLRANSDIKLINHLADMPNVSVSVFGSIEDTIKNKLSKNIIYEGFISQDMIFVEAKNYNGIILPYNNDKFSSTISPAKIFECLLINRLIITRSKLRIFDKYIDSFSIIDNLEEHTEIELRESIKNFIPSITMEEIKKHTWKERLDIMFPLIEGLND